MYDVASQKHPTTYQCSAAGNTALHKEEGELCGAESAENQNKPYPWVAEKWFHTERLHNSREHCGKSEVLAEAGRIVYIGSHLSK